MGGSSVAWATYARTVEVPAIKSVEPVRGKRAFVAKEIEHRDGFCLRAGVIRGLYYQAKLQAPSKLAFQPINVHLLWEPPSARVFAALSACEDEVDRVQHSTSVPRAIEHRPGPSGASKEVPATGQGKDAHLALPA